MRTYEHLQVQLTADGVRTITLSRPERLNAVNPALALEFPEAMQEAAHDDATRAVVITGAGRAFCAGLDLSEPVRTDVGDRSTRHDPYYWVGHWVHAVTGCEKPVIAALNGVAAGAGFGLALACDIRVMSRGTSCTAGYVRRGLSPDAGVSWFLPRLVGHARATEITLTGRDVSAEEAERIGLVAALFDDADFGASVARYAGAIAAGPPLALAFTKRLLLNSASATLDAQLREELTHIKSCFGTKDVAEAMVAFREKRRPEFQGE